MFRKKEVDMIDLDDLNDLNESEKGSGNENNRKMNWKKGGLLILIVIVAILVVAYVGGVFYYKSHFCVKETVFGIPTANQTIDSLREKVQNKVNEYSLTINTKDGSEVITAEQMGLVFDDKGQIQKIMDEQNAFAWPKVFFPVKEETDLAVEIVYDQNMLKEKVLSEPFFQQANIQEPVDAKLDFQDNAYTIIPEETGNQLKQEETLQAIEAAVDNGDHEVDLAQADCYVKPSITSETPELVAQKDLLNKWLGVTITIDFGDRNEVVDAAKIRDWIVTGDDYSADLSWDKASAYVKELGRKYDTYGITRQFNTSKGTTVTVTGGDYGWCMLKDKTTTALVDQIKTGESSTLEPEYLYRAKSRDTDDIGGTYVEISIEDQTMWCYKDGKLLVETPVVTGNPNKGNATPSGSVWAIDAKKSPATLGTMETMGYSSEVNYWMPFTGNVGIHDADGWRQEYGGQIYLSNGSHGCVNTPLEAAKTIYEAVQIGSPVIVY